MPYNLFRKNYAAVLLGIILSLSLTSCATRASYLKPGGLSQKDIGTFGGVDYVPLARVCDVYKLEWSWDTFSKVAILKGMGKRILVREGSPVILVNGEGRSLGKPSMLHEGALYVPVSSILGYLGPIPSGETPGMAPSPVAEKKTFAIKTVVLDAGHGGEDSGARSRRFAIREKDVTLSITKRVNKILEEHGMHVVLTRESDRFLSLSKRSDIANENNADIFVSIHANAARTRQGRGFECFYLSEAIDDNARALEAAENASSEFAESPLEKRSRELSATLWDMVLTENRKESRELARYICNSAETNLSIRNRGVKSARFYVLIGARIPAVLVEVGFLTNSIEGRRLSETRYLDKVSNAIAEGILVYKEEYEKTNGFTQ